MKVILTEDIQGLGSKGQVVAVKDGYGRHFLIPSGKGLPASPGNLARLKDESRQEDMKVRKDKRQAEVFAEQLNGVSCTVRVRADENDRLYGSVGPRDISTALEDGGIQLDAGTVVMDEPIKMLGVYPVKVELFKDVVAEIKVWVVRE